MENNSIFKERWNNDGSNDEYVYHFTSVDSLIKILLTGAFRMNLVERMNDMNESQPIYKRFGIKVDDKELKEISQLEEEIRSRTFLGCFNVLKEDENIRDKVSMWGHYADSGKGVCLKINKSKIDDLLYNKVYDVKNDAIECRIHIEKFNVKYKPQREIDEAKIVYLKNDGNRGLPLYINVRMMYDSKSIEWKAENEFRYLVYNDSYEEIKYFEIEDFTQCIDCIFIGDIQDEASVKLLKSIKERLASNIEFYIREGYSERKFY